MILHEFKPFDLLTYLKSNIYEVPLIVTLIISGMSQTNIISVFYIVLFLGN